MFNFGSKPRNPAIITGVASPTTATAGNLDDVRFDTDGNRWQLIKIDAGVYYWEKYNISITNCIAGEDLLKNEIVYISSVDNKAYKAIASNVTNSILGLYLVSADTLTNANSVLIKESSVTGTGFTIGNAYLSPVTAGANTLVLNDFSTSGMVIRYVGRYTSATNFDFNPSNDYSVV